jgi:hypothetical protein
LLQQDNGGGVCTAAGRDCLQAPAMAGLGSSTMSAQLLDLAHPLLAPLLLHLRCHRSPSAQWRTSRRRHRLPPCLDFPIPGSYFVEHHVPRDHHLASSWIIKPVGLAALLIDS